MFLTYQFDFAWRWPFINVSKVLLRATGDPMTWDRHYSDHYVSSPPGIEPRMLPTRTPGGYKGLEKQRFRQMSIYQYLQYSFSFATWDWYLHSCCFIAKVFIDDVVLYDRFGLYWWYGVLWQVWIILMMWCFMTSLDYIDDVVFYDRFTLYWWCGVLWEVWILTMTKL